MPVSAIAWSTDSSDDLAVARAGRELMEHVAAGHRRLPPEGDVLLDRERGPQLRLLERAPEAAPGTRGGSGPGDVVVVEEDATARRAHETGARVERGGLPGAVRADEPGDATERRPEAQAVDRDEAAVPDGEVDDLEPARRRRSTAAGTGSGTSGDDRTRRRRRRLRAGVPPSRSRNRRSGTGTEAGCRAWRPTPMTANPNRIWR